MLKFTPGMVFEPHPQIINKYFHIYVATSNIQSSKLLLALASKIVLRFESHRDPWPNLCSLQDRLCVWKWDLLLDERRGCFFLIRHHICCSVIQHECARTHTTSK
jgi:hypothetical protein